MADPYEKPRQTLLLDRVGTDGRVGRITLNRPEKLNAMGGPLAAELADAFHRFDGSDMLVAIPGRAAR